MTATAKTPAKTPTAAPKAESTPVPNHVDVIKAAHEKVTVKGDDRKRALRDAALSACAEAFGPFTIVREVTLPKTDPKFSAWITGARGRNGWIIEGRMGKAIVGGTTVGDFIGLGAVTNPDVFKATASEPTMKGIIG